MPRRGGRRDSSAREKPSAAIRERVQRAREKQQTRFHSDAKANCNARMGPRQIKRHCQFSDESQELVRVAMTELNLSARTYDRIWKSAAPSPTSCRQPPELATDRLKL